MDYGLQRTAIYPIMDSVAWLTLSLQLIHSGEARRLFRRITIYSIAAGEEPRPVSYGTQCAAAPGMTLAIHAQGDYPVTLEWPCETFSLHASASRLATLLVQAIPLQQPGFMVSSFSTTLQPHIARCEWPGLAHAYTKPLLPPQVARRSH